MILGEENQKYIEFQTQLFKSLIFSLLIKLGLNTNNKDNVEFCLYSISYCFSIKEPPSLDEKKKLEENLNLMNQQLNYINSYNQVRIAKYLNLRIIYV